MLVDYKKEWYNLTFQKINIVYATLRQSDYNVKKNIFSLEYSLPKYNRTGLTVQLEDQKLVNSKVLKKYHW